MTGETLVWKSEELNGLLCRLFSRSVPERLHKKPIKETPSGAEVMTEFF